MASMKQSSILRGVASKGSVLQVVHAEKVDTFTTSSATFVDVTGLSANITPSATSSKIIVISRVAFSTTGSADAVLVKIVRNSTDLTIGTAASSRPGAAAAGTGDTNTTGYLYSDSTIMHQDSPSSTSSLTYKAQIRRGLGNTAVVNRSGLDNDNAGNPRVFSSITLWEVAG